MRKEGTILIVDDDEDYSCLVQIALQEVHIKNLTKVFQDGAAAVDYLKKAGASGQTEGVPALVFLDLKMPQVNGLEVLDWMRSQPRLAGVPVVLFTGTETAGQQERALALGAASFHVKPFSFHELTRQLGEICDTHLQSEDILRAA